RDDAGGSPAMARFLDAMARSPLRAHDSTAVLGPADLAPPRANGDPPGGPPDPVGIPWGSGPPAPPGFELLDPVGRGGMGVVYRARQVQLGREVSLKMMLPGGPVAPGPSRGRF